MPRKMTAPERSTLTTAAGIPVGDNQNSLTGHPRGPLFQRGPVRGQGAQRPANTSGL